MEKDILIFTVAQGKFYERLASNLFKSIKFFHDGLTTACMSLNKPSSCDIYIPLNCDVNEFSIAEQSYSFKIGAMLHMKDILKDFKKIIYLDCDSECVNKMSFDKTIYDSEFYAAWCQSIVTENEHIRSKINPKWIWQGAEFSNHSELARAYGIKEWKNINAGLICMSCDKVDLICEKFEIWVDRVGKFHHKNFGSEEIILSLMLAEMYPGYETPDICKNGICQLNMEYNPKTIRKEKSFIYNPWYNSGGSSLVRATCVHSPGGKNTLVADIPE